MVLGKTLRSVHMNIENEVAAESTAEDGRIRIPLVGYVVIMLPFLLAVLSMTGKL